MSPCVCDLMNGRKWELGGAVVYESLVSSSAGILPQPICLTQQRFSCKHRKPIIIPPSFGNTLNWPKWQKHSTSRNALNENTVKWKNHAVDLTFNGTARREFCFHKAVIIHGLFAARDALRYTHKTSTKRQRIKTKNIMKIKCEST